MLCDLMLINHNVDIINNLTNTIWILLYTWKYEGIYNLLVSKKLTEIPFICWSCQTLTPLLFVIVINLKKFPKIHQKGRAVCVCDQPDFLAFGGQIGDNFLL